MTCQCCLLKIAGLGKLVPVPADIGDASSPAGLFSSIEDTGFCLWERFFRRHRKKTTTATITTKPSVPPTAPLITALEDLELPEVEEPAGAGVDVDRGAVEERRMFKSLKYSYWSGRSQYVGSNFPSGHVELFMHGSVPDEFRALSSLPLRTYPHCSIPKRLGPARKTRTGFDHHTILPGTGYRELSNVLPDEDYCRGIHWYMGLPCNSRQISYQSRTYT